MKTKKRNAGKANLGPIVLPLGIPETIEELRGEIEVYRHSFRDADHILRDKAALRTIAALRTALKLVMRQNTGLDGRRKETHGNH